MYFSDKFQILHQSASPVYLDYDDSKPIPIYCVASNHSFDDEYEWDRVDTKLPGSSPVMWINVPGAYRCKVIHEGITCASKVINVEVKSKSDSGIMHAVCMPCVY